MNLNRVAACVLVFVSGVATMFAVDRTFLNVPPQPSNKPPVTQSGPDSEPKLRRESPPPVAPNAEPVDPILSQQITQETGDRPEKKPVASADLRIAGVTEPAPGRFAKLPLATSQPVAFIDVKMGDRVKKGWQVFSHWESPERLQAVKLDLEKTRKQLEVGQSRLAAAIQTLERLERLKENIPAQELEDARSLAEIRQRELESLQLAVATAESVFIAMEFEFNQAFVTSPLDGIVAAVDVHQGERRQLSGAFRGVTVIDLRVLNCRCFLEQEQVAKLEAIGNTESEVGTDASSGSDPAVDPDLAGRFQVSVELNNKQWNAKLLSIGVIADNVTGLIPVVFELQNPDETLRSGVRVDVRIEELPVNGAHQDND